MKRQRTACAKGGIGFFNESPISILHFFCLQVFCLHLFFKIPLAPRPFPRFGCHETYEFATVWYLAITPSPPMSGL